MNKVEKIVLTILAIEHLGFGLYGLYDPYSIAELTGYILNSEFALSEIRAYYTFDISSWFYGIVRDIHSIHRKANLYHLRIYVWLHTLRKNI